MHVMSVKIKYMQSHVLLYLKTASQKFIQQNNIHIYFFVFSITSTIFSNIIKEELKINKFITY